MKEVHDKLTYIDDPSQYSCSVWRYQPSHSMLLIRLLRGVIPKADMAYLIFGAVSYFEGPLSWMGADIRVGSLEELEKLLLGLKWIGDDEELLHRNRSGFRLYKFISKPKEIRIIAGILYESMEIPEGFQLIQA